MKSNLILNWNDEDIWVADVHKTDGQWIAKEIVQMRLNKKPVSIASS